MPKTPKIRCFECRGLFRPNRPWSRFCTSQCKARFHNRERLEALKTVRALRAEQAETAQEAPGPPAGIQRPI